MRINKEREKAFKDHFQKEYEMEMLKQIKINAIFKARRKFNKEISDSDLKRKIELENKMIEGGVEIWHGQE